MGEGRVLAAAATAAVVSWGRAMTALLRAQTPSLAPGTEADLVGRLVERRLAAEVAALPGVASFSRPARRELALHRERCGAYAEMRRPTVERVALALREARVRALLLKGEAVVRLTHGDASRRPMADLDVLVAPDERAKASDALRGAGFVGIGADTGLHDVLMDPRAAGPGLPRGVAVEVHDDVFERPHPFRTPAEAALRRAVPGLSPPCAEHALALTALAFAVHENDGRKSWLGLRDIALLEAACSDEGALREALGAGAEAVAVRELSRLARERTGGPGWAEAALGAARCEGWRRRLAVRLLVRELAASLDAATPAPRQLGRRVAQSLWTPSAWTSAREIARRALHAGGGGPWRRLSRHARAVRSLGR